MIDPLDNEKKEPIPSLSPRPLLSQLTQKMTALFVLAKTMLIDYPFNTFSTLYRYHHYKESQEETLNLFARVHTPETQEKAKLSTEFLGKNIFDACLQDVGQKALATFREETASLIQKAGLADRNLQVYTVTDTDSINASAYFDQLLLVSPLFLVKKEMLPENLLNKKTPFSTWSKEWMKWYTENIYKDPLFAKILEQEKFLNPKTIPEGKPPFTSATEYRTALLFAQRECQMIRSLLKEDKLQTVFQAIIAHELGHIHHFHAKKTYLRFFYLDLLNICSFGLLYRITEIFKKTFKRDQEFEADAFMHKLVGSIGAITHFTKVKEMHQTEKDASLEEEERADFFKASSHPSLARRIAALKQLDLVMGKNNSKTYEPKCF